MSNVLSEAKKQQVIALGRLGWPLRRIEQETGVRRETAGAYLKAAVDTGAWGRRLSSPVAIGKMDPRGKPAGGTEDRSDSFGGGKLPQIETPSAPPIWPRLFPGSLLSRSSASQKSLPLPGPLTNRSQLCETRQS
jgi:hypothetical protein